MARQSDNRFRLVFLTRGNRKPEDKEDQQEADALEGKGNFSTITYEKEVRNWLVACRQDTQAESVRRFLGDFIDYVQTMEATGTASQQEIALVMNYLRENPKDNIRIADAVRQAWPRVIEQTAANFLKALEGELREKLDEAWIIEWAWILPKLGGTWGSITAIPAEKLLEKYGTFLVSKSVWARRYGIAMAFNRSDCQDLGRGILKHESAPDVPSLNLKLAKATGHAAQSWPTWVWGFDVDGNHRNWNTPETLERLSDPPEREKALSYFVDWFLKLKEVAEGDIDAAIRNPMSGTE